jgi:hypothetical protein
LLDLHLLEKVQEDTGAEKNGSVAVEAQRECLKEKEGREY